MGARLALGKYEEGLKAAEAALVLSLDLGDERAKAYTLFSIAKAHVMHGMPAKASGTIMPIITIISSMTIITSIIVITIIVIVYIYIYTY